MKSGQTSSIIFIILTFFFFQEAVASKDIDVFSFHDSLIKVMKECGLENDLRNGIYYWMKEYNYFQTGAGCWIEKEPFEYLREAQVR